MSKPKSSRPAEIDPSTQLFHGLVDTLRLLPSISCTSRPPGSDIPSELRIAQKEKKTLDEAFEQLNQLIRLRREELGVNGPAPATATGPGNGNVPGPGPNTLPANIQENGNGVTQSHTGNGNGNGVEVSPIVGSNKRKRDRRISISVSASPGPLPPPLPSTETISAPSRIEVGNNTPKSIIPTGPPKGLSVSVPNAALGSARSLSPLPPLTAGLGSRSGTPMSRQSTIKDKKDLLADQLPLLKGRRVLFKQPIQAKDKDDGEAEEDAWILGSVVGCIGGDKNRYTIKDADTEATVLTYNTTLRSIIPLPDSSLPTTSSAHPSNIEHYPKNTQVLAWYPDTTIFYPAIVLATPAKNRGMYKVQFEDDGVPSRDVSPSDVVLMPGGNAS